MEEGLSGGGGLGDWLTFTKGRTFILVPDAPLPHGSSGQTGLSFTHREEGDQTPKTHSHLRTHTAHDILFRVFGFCNPAAILARKQQVFIVKQQVLVFIMINSICLQI